MSVQELKETVWTLPYLETLRPESADDLLNKAPPVESWPTFVNSLKDLILAEDPYEFQKWRIIRDTMMGTQMGTGHSLEYLKARPDWDSRWSPLITDEHALFDSKTAVLHAYHIAQFEERTGLHIDDLEFVLEFGGGYGNMCYLFHKLGFQGNYVLFDFPVLLALQEFFLAEMGVSATYISNPEGVAVMCSPSLFVALFSISEAPYRARQPFEVLAPDFDSFLIGYSSGGVHISLKNNDYFQRWMDDLPDIEWHHERMPWTRSGYWFTGGKKK